MIGYYIYYNFESNLKWIPIMCVEIISCALFSLGVLTLNKWFFVGILAFQYFGFMFVDRISKDWKGEQTNPIIESNYGGD